MSTLRWIPAVCVVASIGTGCEVRMYDESPGTGTAAQGSGGVATAQPAVAALPATGYAQPAATAQPAVAVQPGAAGYARPAQPAYAQPAQPGYAQPAAATSPSRIGGSGGVAA